MLVILGIALPVTEILSNRIPAEYYQGFYVYNYTLSIAFVVFVYVQQLRQKAVQSIIKTYRKSESNCFKAFLNLEIFKDEKTSGQEKKKAPQMGSFYLRIGAIAFGIGTMVYSGLELGQYFEIESGEGSEGCQNVSS